MDVCECISIASMSVLGILAIIFFGKTVRDIIQFDEHNFDDLED